VEQIDTSPPATPEQQSFLRSAIGIFRFYAQAIDGSILFTLSKLATQQSAPTTNTMAMLDRFLNYISHYPDASIVYRPSNMQLHVHSDESYCGELNSRSRCAACPHVDPLSLQVLTNLPLSTVPSAQLVP